MKKVKVMNDNIQGIKRTVCEIWSRVVGYYRPVQSWNKGKKAEFKDRKTFKITKEEEKKND